MPIYFGGVKEGSFVDGGTMTAGLGDLVVAAVD
jgi:hypothetical protein